MRRDMIREQVEAAAARALDAECGHRSTDLLDEVTGLVEWPVALTGSFEERFLAVPQEALVSSMKEHQKYFHVVDENGALKPNFITLCNIESKDPIQVIAGNERVIRPRLADAAFFFETDKKTPLADRVAALESIVFQQKLGTLKDKTDRLVRLAGALAPLLGADKAQAERAALLAKTDLVTDMVLEFSDMQGIAGSYYATADGEAGDVAAALAQQYWPKFAGDRLPESSHRHAPWAWRTGWIRWSASSASASPPPARKDPFALRRASLAVSAHPGGERRWTWTSRECLATGGAGLP